jgi:hypothetical protein
MPTQARSTTRPPLKADRALVAMGVLLLSTVVLHYAMDLVCVFNPQCHAPWPPVARFACLCSVSAILVGVAMVLRSPRLGTYGVVFWLFFPLSSQFDDVLIPLWWLIRNQILTGMLEPNRLFQIHWSMLYSPVLLVAGILCLASGLYVKRDLLFALGLALLAFFVKGTVNHLLGGPELQLWLDRLIGAPSVARHFMTINVVGLVLGVAVTGAGWWVRRR